MVNFKSISTKVHIPLISSLLIGLVTVTVVSFSGLKDIEKGVYTNEYHSMIPFLEKNHEAKETIVLSNVLLLGKDKTFSSALEYNDKQLARHRGQELADYYKNNSKFKDVKIHLHTSDIKSFIRVWNPEKNGDDLSSFRHTINEVKNIQKPFAAVEIGRAGLTYRGLSPIKNNENQYVGSVEFILGFESNIKAAKEDLNGEGILLMDQKYLDIAAKLKENPKIGHFVLAQDLKTADKALIKDLQNDVDIETIKDYQVTNEHFIVKTPLKDFKGDIVGYFVVGKDLSTMEGIINDAKATTFTQLITMGIVDMIVLILLILIVNRSIKTPLNHLTKTTEELASGKADLTKRMPITSKDEIAEASSWVNSFIQRIQDTLNDAKTSSSQNSAVASEFTKITQEMNEKVQNSAKITEDLARNGSAINTTLHTSLEEVNTAQSVIEVTKEKLTIKPKKFSLN